MKPPVHTIIIPGWRIEVYDLYLDKHAQYGTERAMLRIYEDTPMAFPEKMLYRITDNGVCTYLKVVGCQVEYWWQAEPGFGYVSIIASIGTSLEKNIASCVHRNIAHLPKPKRQYKKVFSNWLVTDPEGKEALYTEVRDRP